MNGELVAGDLGHLASEIDAAVDRSDIDALAGLIESCASRLQTAKGSERVALHYFEANAHLGLHDIASRDDRYRWQWDQPHATAAILALRRALREPAFASENTMRRWQIPTNLANILSHVGRPVEAIEQWTAVLHDRPTFAIARGNRADGLCYYAFSLYDKGHQRVLMAEAYSGFISAVKPDALWDSGFRPEVADYYAKSAEAILKRWPIAQIKAEFDPTAGSLGKTAVEKKYRAWALSQCLFLNPLNDAGGWPIAARDVFHLPSHSYNLDEEPRFVKFFDLLKSEFVGARTLYFEAAQLRARSFADKHVLRFDSFDGARYGIRLEKLKASFRSAYSLFDKVSVFINDYFRLERSPREINFRNVFYEPREKGRPRTLSSSFSGRENWALRGLFSLSKDLLDREFQDTASPDARMVDVLRNAAEHRFLSLHEYLSSNVSVSDAQTSIAIDDFERITLRLLKRARAALIYLSLAVRREEAIRKKNDSRGFIVPFMSVPLKPE
jgi:hypothetical protein